MLRHYSLMFFLTLLSLLMTTPIVVHAEGNGNDRGGGDPVAAEVFGIARGTVKKLLQWSKDGTLQLSFFEIEKIQNLVNCAKIEQRKQECLLVISSERAYRFPDKLPTIDAIEVTMVNVANHNPPMIEVGRIRWAELEGKPLEKEMMVLHELMGAAGLKSNSMRTDDQFYTSYELKNKTLEVWAKFKEQLNASMLKVYHYNLSALHLDVSNMKTFGETLELMPSFHKIIHPELHTKKKKDQAAIQLSAYDELVGMIQAQSFIGKNMQTSSDFNKNAAETELQKIGLTIKNHPEWKNWAVSVINTYIKDQKNLMQSFSKELNNDFSYRYLVQNCPDPNTGALDKLAVCVVDSFKTGMQNEIEQMSKSHIQKLALSFDQMMESINSITTPDEIVGY